MSETDIHKAEIFAKYYVNNLNVAESYRLMTGQDEQKSYAYTYFKKDEVQQAVQRQIQRHTSRLDISYEKTLKHLAAIAYGNPLECIHTEGYIDDDGVFQVESTRVKAPCEIPLWQAICITKVKENASADGGVTMEYGFESKVPALKLLLEQLEKVNQTDGEMTITIEHKNVDKIEHSDIEVVV